MAENRLHGNDGHSGSEKNNQTLSVFKEKKERKEEKKAISLRKRGKLGSSQFIRNLFIFSVLIRCDGS